MEQLRLQLFDEQHNEMVNCASEVELLGMIRATWSRRVSGSFHYCAALTEFEQAVDGMDRMLTAAGYLPSERRAIIAKKFSVRVWAVTRAIEEIHEVVTALCVAAESRANNDKYYRWKWRGLDGVGSETHDHEDYYAETLFEWASRQDLTA